MSCSPEDFQDVHRLDAQLLSDLWIFRSAARLGSITAASRHLGVTQAAVSQRISRLEARIGVPVFNRLKGRIELTEAGSSLLEGMTQVALILNDGLSKINRAQRKSIVVSCIPSLATEWLVPHLEEFYLLFPGVEVFVRSELAPSTVGRLEDDGVDIVIDYQPAPAPDLVELAAVQEYVFPVCSEAYRERLDHFGDTKLPVTLLHDDVPWWGGTADCEWKNWLASSGMDWPVNMMSSRHFNLAHLAYHAAIGHQGVAIGRSIIVNRLLKKGELVPALNKSPLPGSSYRVSTHRPGDARSPARQFASWWATAMSKTQADTLLLLNTTADHDLECLV